MIEKPRDVPELAYWLALLHAPGVGAITFLALLDYYSTPRAVFEAKGAGRDTPRVNNDGLVPPRMGAATLAYLRNPDWATVEKDLAWQAQPDNHIITLHDPAYPPLLKQIADAPPLLFVRGQPGALVRPQLAMVGSRNPSAGGKEIAHDFARHLASAGLTITSGLALGIDAASHQGALHAVGDARDANRGAGHGVTVAVTGTGLDRVYPARHRDLAHQIAEHGALVSEFPPGMPPLAENFPRRNRIISGLSVGVLVVEAALQSGSLITARLAGDQGREVFAIPGSIHNPLARGCHALIRQGAKLVENVHDILEELGAYNLNILGESASHETDFGSDAGATVDDNHLNLLSFMDFSPASVDILVERSGLTPEQVSSMLLVLELHNRVESVAGGLYIRVSRRS